MWTPNPDRYQNSEYRRCGRSGLKLPPISLGLWQNFGHGRGGHGGDERVQREILRTAVDAGITHFDLANNYGPPPGSAETMFGTVMASDFAGLRDELIISTKAGYEMWEGPYGDGGSRKYLVASLDQSLARMGLDYVDIFYHHRWTPDTPLEETMAALDQIVRAGKALYIGISSYSASQTRRALAMATDLHLPLVIHQPSYSMLNRWVEQPDDHDEEGASLLEVCGQHGLGVIAFSPLQQGLLTDRYLTGIPEGSRATQGYSLGGDQLDQTTVAKLRALHELAGRRGQPLAAMALAWLLHDERITSVLVGASSAEQLRTNLTALTSTDFDADELGQVDMIVAE